MRLLGDVEEDDVVPPVIGHGPRHALDEISVGIDEREAGAGSHVIPHKGFKERRLAGARLADRIYMEEPIGSPNPKAPPLSAKVRSGEYRKVVLFVVHPLPW